MVTFWSTEAWYWPAHCWYIGAAKVEPAPLMVPEPEPPPLLPLEHAAASSAIPAAAATAVARDFLGILTVPLPLAWLHMSSSPGRRPSSARRPRRVAGPRVISVATPSRAG